MKKVIILNGPPACVDADTEFLTSNGWKKISQYKEGDLVAEYNSCGSIRYTAPVEYIKSGGNHKFIHLTGKYTDMLLTPNHRVVYRTGKTGTWREKTAQEFHSILNKNRFGFDGNIPCSFKLSLPDYPISDNDLKFIVMLSADGRAVLGDGQTYITVKHGYKKDACEEILNSCGYSFTVSEYGYMPGYKRYWFKSRYPKGLPEFFYLLSERQRKIVRESLLFWDGDGKHTFRTTLEKDRDIAQFIFASLGERAYISVDDRRGEVYGKGYVRKSVCYAVSKNLSRKDSFGLESIVSVESDFTGDCYCFVTTTGMWLARRNGKIFVTGNSGKDVGAKEMCAVLGGNKYLCYHRQFKDSLIDITCAIYGISGCEWNNLYTREGKEKPYPKLGGLTPREALIYVSENIIKPSLGFDFFGRSAAQSLYEGVNIFSDGGFIEEVRPLITEVGVPNILIVRIHREGCSFKGDSRNYLPDGFGPIVIDIENNGTEQEYFDKLEYEITRWLEKGVNDE